MKVVSSLMTTTTLALLASAAFGQTDTASLAGTVVDASGAVIPGAEVDLRNTSNGLERKV